MLLLGHLLVDLMVVGLHREGWRRWWRLLLLLVLLWLLLGSEQFGSDELWRRRNWTRGHAVVMIVAMMLLLLLPFCPTVCIGIGLMAVMRYRCVGRCGWATDRHKHVLLVADC